MRRIALVVVAASVLFTASRSEAQTTYTLEGFTFSPRTATLVGATNCLGDVCETVTLVVDASTEFLPPNPVIPTDPYYGLFGAWLTLDELPPNPVIPVDPYYGLLVALGHQGAGAIVTTLDGSTLATFQPIAQ